jgi:hypothetical protein
MLFSMPRGATATKGLEHAAAVGGRFDPDATPLSGHHSNDIGFAPHNLALKASETCEIACYFKVLTPNAVP